MYRYIAVFVALVACSSAKPAIVAPISYGAPFYPSAGTSQVDIRNSYNGAYSTALGYTAPFAARFAAPSGPFAYTSPVAKYAAPAIATPFGYTAPAPVAKYASPLAAPAYAAPYAAAYTPYAGAYPSYPSPYALTAPAAAPYFL